MNTPEVYSLDRGDTVRLKLDSGEEISGEVMENTTFEAPDGVKKQAIHIQTPNGIFTIEKDEKGNKTEEHPLQGNNIQGFVTEVEHIKPTEIV